MNKYWVGGSGNWFDVENHWSNSSGGQTFSIGDELMANPTFTGNATGWKVTLNYTSFLNIPNGDWTYADNKVSRNANTYPYALGQTNIAKNSTFYKISIDIVVTSFTGYFYIVFGNNGTGATITESGHYEFTMKSSTTVESQSGFVGLVVPENFVGSVDSFSVKEITNLPTSSDNVIIDSNSGLSDGEIYLGNMGVCKDFTSETGANWYFSSEHGYIQIYGSLQLESGITGIGVEFDFWASDSQTIKMNGCLGIGYLEFMGLGDWKALDDITLTDEFYQDNGTFDANDFNITAGDYYFYSNTNNAPTIKLGNGIWTPARSTWVIEENNGVRVTIIEPPVFGCTDPTATNYDSLATQDNGTCIYPPKFPESFGASSKDVHFKRNFKNEEQKQGEIKRLSREYLKRTL